MDYTNFQKYPLQILGVNESYNEELTAIEELVVSEIDYSGNADDLLPLLPYFVFYKFNDKNKSTVTISGELAQVAEFTFQINRQMDVAWNIGAYRLTNLCTEKNQTANETYKSNRTSLW